MTTYADESEVFDEGPAPGWKPAKSAQPDSVGKRFATGLADPFYGIAQLTEKAINAAAPFIPTAAAAKWLTSQSANAATPTEAIQQREAEYSPPEGFDVARVAGNVLSPAGLVGTPAKGARLLTRSLAARAATGGAVQGTLAPSTSVDDYWQEKLTGAALGAALGGAVGKLTTGVTPTPKAKALMDAGIQPSVGQSVPGLNALEQKTSTIFPGSVGAARGRPLAEWQEQIIRRTVPGARTLDEANDIASGMYKEVVPHLKPNQQTAQLVNNAGANAIVNPELTPQNAKLLSDIVDRRFANYAKLDGDGIKALDSDLGALVRKYKSSSDVSHHAIADGLHDVQAALRQGMEVGLPADLQGKMVVANKAWRELIPINKAASSRADQQVTPRALQKALARQAGTDVTRMKSDPLVDNAVDVLGNTVPDSGTAGRLLVPGAIAGGATGYLPHMLAAGVVARTGATRPVQAAILGNIAAQKALSPHSPAFARALAAALRGTPDEAEATFSYATDDEVFQ